ncbi:mitoguardin-like [Anabrus simplex]|uniref:mitoguardin-like n=1 Tax=Anabrus simplex TaxID=316456 RepID=UPI0034DD99F5
MSLMIQISPLLAKMPAFRLPIRNIQLSVPQKVTIISVSVGVVLIGFLARYFRRRRRIVHPGNLRRLEKRTKGTLYGMKSPNGDAQGQVGRRSASPSIRSFHRQASIVSDRMSVASGSISSGLPVMSGEPGASLTPQQLGLMGE